MKYKIDVMSELKARGYSTYRLRKEKLFGQTQIAKIRNGEILGVHGLNRLCELLGMSITELIDDGSCCVCTKNDAGWGVLTYEETMFLLSQLHSDYEELYLIYEHKKDEEIGKKAAVNAAMVYDLMAKILGIYDELNKGATK